MRKAKLIALVAGLIAVALFVGEFKWGIFRNLARITEKNPSPKERLSVGGITLSQRKLKEAFSSLKVQLIGSPYPVIDFTLKNLQGERISTKDLRGKFVWISFWATWCGPCRGEMPSMQEVWEKFGGKDFVILAVDVGENEQTVRSFVQNNGYTFPVLLDREGQVGRAYRVRGIPASFFVSPEGKIIGKAEGAREWADEKFYDFLKNL